MKQYKYRGFENPIIVDNDGKATYRRHELKSIIMIIRPSELVQDFLTIN